MPRKITTGNNVNANSNDEMRETKDKPVKKTGRRSKTEPEQVTQKEELDVVTEQKQETQQEIQQENQHSDWEEGDNSGITKISGVCEDKDEEETEPVRVILGNNSDKVTRSTRQTNYTRNNTREHHNHREYREPREPREQREPREPREHNTQRTMRPKSAALSFSYNDYKTYNETVGKASTPDLLRVLIVRAHEDGQVHLKRCLETTLRAVNLECKFPSLPPPRRPMPNQ